MSMTGIQIQVTGNIAKVLQRPQKITTGTVGLPVTFSFDSQWDGLQKVAVFQAGETIRVVDKPDDSTVIPWEVLTEAGVWLCIGVYGSNTDGSLVIPTVWASVGSIEQGVNPAGDPAASPSLPIWQAMINYVNALSARPAAAIVTITLPAAGWIGTDSFYSQRVSVNNITAKSQVDLKPNAQQLSQLRETGIAFQTENDDGILTVYALGDKPTEDYVLEASVTEVTV